MEPGGHRGGSGDAAPGDVGILALRQLVNRCVLEHPDAPSAYPEVTH